MDSAPLLPTEQNQDDEHYRLGAKSSIRTIFSLLSGPILSQLTNSIYGVVNSLWVAKGIGNSGLEVLSAMFFFDMVVFAFGSFASISASSHISYLFGQGKQHEVAQLVVDLFRVVIGIGILYPLIVLPSTKPIVKWLVESDEITEKSFQYMCFSAGGSIIMFSFQLMCGILQGEGRTWLFGSMQIVALVADMFGLLPLMIFVLHLDVWCAALSMLISQFIPMMILIGMLLCDKFSMSITCDMFFNKFSPETYKALKVGFSSFILNLSEAFPQFALQKYIMLVASRAGILEPLLSMFSVFSRLYGLGICILIALDCAFIPAASYAFGKREYRRVVKLALHTLWITIVWSALFSFFMIIFPGKIIGIFTNDKNVLEHAKGLIPYGFYTLPLYCIHAIVVSILQATKRPVRSAIISIATTLIPMPLISTVIYFTIGKDNIKWIFSTYIFDDFATSLISILGSLYPFYLLWKTKNGDEFPDEGKKIEESNCPISTSSSIVSLDNPK